MTKPLAYSYIRMSSELQLKGDSLRRQTELSERYAAENGLELVENFKLHDIGVSAYKGANIERGALGRFLEAIKEGSIPKGSYLLVESLDRLSRQNITNSVSLFLEITESGVNIVTLADGHIYQANKTDFSQLIYSIVILARANEESEIKSSRISAAWRSKRQNISDRIMTRTCPAWLKANSEKTGFDVIEERVDIVRRIFRSAAEGQGSGIITRSLNNEGAKPFGRSKGWIESYVTKILKNRAVLGEFQPHVRIDGKRVPDGPIIENYFPKIIDEELFLRVQAGRRERAKNGAGRRGPKQRNLFTNVVKCGYCASSMRFINKGNGPKGGQYLKCSASVTGMDCNPNSWRYHDFEKSVFSFVREFDLRSVIEDNQKRSETVAIREEIALLREKLEHRETERNRILELLIGVSKELESYYKTKMEELTSEIAATSSEIDELETSRANLNSATFNVADAEDQLLALHALTEHGDFQRRLNVSIKLKSLIERIEVFVVGKTQKFDKIQRLAMDNFENAEERDKVLAVLMESHYEGPLSTPYFTVVFRNGTSRTVVPEASDPTKLRWQISEGDDGVMLTDENSDSVVLFPPRVENS